MTRRQTSLRPEEGGKFHRPVVGVPTGERTADEERRLLGKECCLKGNQTRAGVVGIVRVIYVDEPRDAVFAGTCVAGVADAALHLAHTIEPVQMVDSHVCRCGGLMVDHQEGGGACDHPSAIMIPKYAEEDPVEVERRVRAFLDSKDPRDVAARRSLSGGLTRGETAVIVGGTSFKYAPDTVVRVEAKTWQDTARKNQIALDAAINAWKVTLNTCQVVDSPSVTVTSQTMDKP